MQDWQFFSSTKQLKKLRLLENLHKDNELTQRQLAEKVGITKGMVSRYLKKFREENLVSKEEKDQLTSEGITALHNLQEQYQQELNQLDTFLKRERKKYSGQNVKQIKVAAIRSLGTTAPYLAEKFEILDNYGVEVEIDYYQSGQQLMENFSSRNYDFGLLGIVPAFLWQVSGSSIEIEARVNKGGHAIIGKKEVASLANLAGKTVLVPVVNDSVSDNLLKKLSQQEGFEVNKVDFAELNLSFDQVIASKFDLAQVDAILLWEPCISYLLQKNDNFHLIYDFKDYHDNYSANVLISNQKQATDYLTELIDKIFIDTLEKIEANSNLTQNYLSDFFKMKEEVIASALRRVEYQYFKEWEAK